jgi:CheY-like chemotaxis protein
VVRAVGSAAEALAVIRQWLPDVLVSDISMPDEDGYALIRQVRALEARQGGGTPALAFMALTGTEACQRALTAGFQIHLSKPAEPFELATLVANLSQTGEADKGRGPYPP